VYTKMRRSFTTSSSHVHVVMQVEVVVCLLSIGGPGVNVLVCYICIRGAGGLVQWTWCLLFL
jgi:hypothetical protein